MKASLEISMYPLNESYKKSIFAFIDRLKNAEGLEVIPNGMSTQVFGELERIFEVLKENISEYFEDENEKAMFVMKLGKGTLKL